MRKYKGCKEKKLAPEGAPLVLLEVSVKIFKMYELVVGLYVFIFMPIFDKIVA